MASPFPVIVSFVDDSDASANKFQQRKRLCTLDDIASPTGGTDPLHALSLKF